MGKLVVSPRVFACAVAVIAFFALAPCQLPAQEVTASISGTVTDPSGAPVADAKVTAKDLDRGTTYSTTSNSSGIYNLPRMAVGRYEVRVESPGFQTAVRSDILLQLNQAAKVDMALTLGNVSESVEVTGAAPLLQTEATQLGTVIDARTNAQLPLATRNYVQLTLLTAGAVTPNPSGFQSGQTSFQSARPYINGNRQQTNNFLLDGIDNNQVSDNVVAYAPSVDAIEEFNIITQNPSAEFGNFMGGIVSVSIKSGTNKLHGNVFEFIRNDKLNANTWTNNFQGHARPLLRWNMFGGTLGGPVIKNKLFLFGDYQGSRYDQPGTTGSATVLTALERQGNFSELLTQAKPSQLFNPYDTFIDENGNPARRPFAGNVIPVNLLNPAAVKIVTSQYYPQPVNGNILNNQFNTTHSFINGDQGDIRGDWNASDADHVSVRYSKSNINNPTINSLPLSYNTFGIYRIHNGSIDYIKTLSPALVNDVRFGVNYTFNNTGTDQSSLPNLAEQFGIPGVPIPILPAQNFTGANISNFGSSNNIQLFADTVIQYQDTVIWTAGEHTMKFGFQGMRDRIDTFYSGNNGAAGIFAYNGQFTAGPSVTQKFGAGSGQPEADFMLGMPNDVGVGVNGGTWGQRTNILSAFGQDTWRATNNLTLTYGVRYEVHTPWVEVKDRQANFTPFGGQQIIAGSQQSYYGNSRALYNQYNGIFNFQPRLGFAYTPTKSMVIRAAYTLSSYLEGTGTNLRLPINPPFTVEKEGNYAALALPGSTLDQGYVPIESATDPFHNTILRLWDPNFRPAVSQQWNFSIQQQFGNTTTLQVGYVGQKNDHLVVAQPYLQRQLLADGTTIPSPFLSGNPALQSDIGNISGTEANGNQEYDALQVTLQKRLAHGLSGQFAYTWSKCMTDSIGFYGDGSQSAPTSAYVQDLYNRAAEWGPCLNDVAHVVSAFASYDLPFGRGRAFGKDMNKVANAFVGGWQVNAIMSFHGGFPLTITGSDNSGTKARSARANCLATPVIFGEQNSPRGGYQWFDPSSTYFAPAAAGTFGSCGVGTVRGPGLHTADLSLSKKFQFTEFQNIELRGEFINALNVPILNAPTRSLGSNLGLLQSSQGARNIQIGLKYNF